MGGGVGGLKNMVFGGGGGGGGGDQNFADMSTTYMCLLTPSLSGAFQKENLHSLKWMGESSPGLL